MAIDTVARGLYNELWIIVQQLGVDGVPGGGGGGDMFKADNLAGLANVPTARTNLGLGTAATFDSSQFAASSSLATKADLVHTHTSASITDFQEAVEDIVGTGLVAGTNITLAYDDTTGKTTITSSLTGGGGGDVHGPASSTTNELMLFGDTTGKLAKVSGCVPTASGFSLISSADYAAMKTLLNVGASANHADTFFLQSSLNLSDLASAGVARTNLGLGTAAVQNVSAFLQPANNLSEIASAATARTNLGLGSSSVHPSTDFAPTIHTHAYTDITNFGVGVNNKIAAGSGITLSYDAGTGITTITATGGSSSSTGFNPADAATNLVFSNLDTTMSKVTTNSYASSRSKTSKTSGKKYFEATFGSVVSSGGLGIGVGESGMTLAGYVGQTANSVGLRDNGFGENNGTVWMAGPSDMQWNGAFLFVAVDVGARKIWFKKNGGTNWNNSGTANPATGVGGISISGSGPLFAVGSVYSPTDAVTLNLGSSVFAGSIPSGFSAWD